MNNIKYFKPKERVLDFSNCKYLGEVHEIIKNVLELPDWYGQNLDALWDSITGLMYVPAEIKIIYKPKEINPELSKEIIKIINVFKEAENEYNEISLSVEIN